MLDSLPSILAQGGRRPRLLAPGLEADAIAAARPALDPLLRGMAPGLGLVLLRRRRDGLPGAPHHWALHRWTSAGLERAAPWLPGHDRPPLPTSAVAGGFDVETELPLPARVAALRQRRMPLAERPDAEAYLAAA